ncbi:MAG: MIP/aquaporin family protein [Verrucomicrobiales bacterium]
MISAATFTILLEHPDSPAVAALPDAFVRRMLIGVAMGLTALALILSPMGKRSGAHFNPAVTLTFWRLGKVQTWDALFYVVAQFLGGVAGVAIVAAIAPRLLADSSVNYVATLPGAKGAGIAFASEFAISFVLMLTNLNVSNHPQLNRYTPFFAATLVATFITFEAPFSGMSMNPARTFGSALVGGIWTALWIYFTAPVLAMLCAAFVYRRAGRAVYCAKLHHHNGARCIFNCAFDELLKSSGVRPGALRGDSPAHDERPCAGSVARRRDARRSL